MPASANLSAFGFMPLSEMMRTSRTSGKLAEQTSQVKAVDVGEHQVKQHQFWLDTSADLSDMRLATIASDSHLMANTPKQHAQRMRGIVIVVDE